MTGPFERYLRKTVWFLAVLILFLLLFEKHLALPAWVQVIGRMHPVLLHFPIAFLVIAIGVEFYKAGQMAPVVADVRRPLWLISALLTALTVLMGIFLSQEEGYEGSTVLWHKWSGVAVFYLSSLYYYFYDHPKLVRWKKPVMVLAAVLLFGTGHYGAVLTHGENFISEPLRKDSDPKQTVPIDQAIVYDHLVLPILESKCAGCHNESKSKGELILTDSIHLMKGGKSGLLVTAYQPDLSLMIERIHMPIDDKKHMPPRGKPQLTPLEENILIAWIKAGMPFSTKVSDLTPQDSLHILAKQVLNAPARRDAEPVFTFKPAKPETIESLTNEYRSILPVAHNSPALTVSIYGAHAYSAKSLEELSPLKTQIVELNLSRMPLSNRDLQLITSFENLRKLNLNFTSITAEGLAQLEKLKNLQVLLLAGTETDGAGLAKLVGNNKSLRQITLWETRVDQEQITNLRRDYPSIDFVGDFFPQDTSRFKLNNPLAKSDNWVFDTSSMVELYHPVRGTRLHYTLDGTDPDSLSPLADQPIRIDQTTIVRVRGYKDGWHPSDVAEYQIFRNTYKPDSVFLINKLNHVHLAEGAHTFFDRLLGKLGANNPAWANHFAGVRNEDMQLLCWFNNPVELSRIGLRIMVEEETGIYPPGTIEIWAGEDEKHLRVIAKDITPHLPAPGEKPSLKLLEVPLRGPVSVKCLKIVAKPFQRPGEGPKLLLIDEMFLN